MASFAKKPERYRLLLLGAMLLVAACNNPDQQHNVLNFFFDGVPDPNAPPETQTADPKLPGKRKSFEPASLKPKAPTWWRRNAANSVDVKIKPW